MPLTDEEIAAHELEMKAVALTTVQGTDYTKVISMLSDATEICPTWASAYNNRAQAYRIVRDEEAALNDLNTALELDSTSTAAAQAFTQRALLHRLNGNEDSAIDDFKRAAHLGNAFAKQQIVALNPYAALCTTMLSEVFDKIKRGEYVEEPVPETK